MNSARNMTTLATSSRHDSAPDRPFAGLAWTLCACVILLGLASLVLFVLNRDTAVAQWWSTTARQRNAFLPVLRALLLGLGLPAVSATLGALIVSRQPRHRIGWLLLLYGLVAAASHAFGELTVYSWLTLAEPPLVGALSAWVQNWLWIVGYALAMLILALLPTGRFLSRGWAVALAIPWLLFTLSMWLAGAIEQPMTGAYSLLNPLVDRPPLALYNALFALGVPMMLLAAAMVFAQIAARFRRSGEVERQQIKWLVAGLGAMVLLVSVGIALTLDSPSTTWTAALGALLLEVAPILPLAAIGIAILRFRLYDIDVIIRKTLIYATLTALLALFYFSSIILLQSAVHALTGQDSPLVIVLSTLLIAALFTPLRRRVQTAIDRRFYRRKYDAQQVLAQFAHSARDEVELDALSMELVRVVQETMQPEKAALWLREPAANHFARLRGVATANGTTDEIMALTRAE